jgi:hypothetical protein
MAKKTNETKGETKEKVSDLKEKFSFFAFKYYMTKPEVDLICFKEKIDKDFKLTEKDAKKLYKKYFG